MARVTITSSIPLGQWEEAQSMGWKWQELIREGIQAKKNFPKVLERQRELETTNEQLLNKIQDLAQRLYAMEEHKNV